MSDPDTTESGEKSLGAAKKRDEETSPFPLERSKSEPPPPNESETTGERTGPFVLTREKSTPDNEVVDAPPPPTLSRAARRARRSIAFTLFLHALALAGLAAFSVVRWTKHLATPPELALAVLWGGVSLVHLRAGTRFFRLGRQPVRDAHLLAGAFADLRTVIILKAVALFLTLTLLCFSLSMVISLVASI
jgi:hypothetical protein